MVRPLKDLLPILLSKQHEWKAQLLHAWPTIMGKFAPQVRLEKIEEELLVLGVFDACWMQELYLLTPTLLKKINENLDKPRIKQLRFKRAGIFTAPMMSAIKPKERRVQPSLSVLTAREQRVAQGIKDQQLRDALIAFLYQCKKE